MKKKTWLSLSLLVCAFAPSSWASVSALSWKECVEQASLNNADLKSAIEAYSATQFTSLSARSNFVPHLYGSTGFTRTKDSDPDKAELQPTNEYNAKLTASYTLYNGYEDQAKLDQARAQERGQFASLLSTKARVTVDLKTAYANLLYAQRSTHLESEIIRRREENLKMVELRFQNGTENKGSVLLSRADLESSKFDALQAEHNTYTYRTTLSRVIGAEQNSEFQLTEDFPLSPLPEKPDFMKLSLETPDHAQATSQVEVADSAVVIARSGFLPALNLSSTAIKAGPTGLPSHTGWNVGASLSIPIFSGGSSYYDTKSANASLRSATFSRVSTDQQTASKLEQNFYSYAEAIQKLKVDQSYLEAAKIRAEIARNKYRTGLMSYEDWAQIENDLIAREKGYLQSQRDQSLAEAYWVQSLGKGVIP